MESRKNYITIPGSERTLLPGAYLVSQPYALRTIGVTVVVRPRPSGEGIMSVEEMGARRPRDRQYISREKYATAYGSDHNDVDKVRRFASRYGLAVVRSSAVRRTIELYGTVADFSRAFNVQLGNYWYMGKSYLGRTGGISVPRELGGIVQAVLGLDNRPQARPHFRHSLPLGGIWPHATGVSYTPVEVAKLYNFPTGVNGQGQCIAIIELGGGYIMKDLNTYFQQLGIPTPNISSISILGAHNAPTGNPNGPDGEVMLDIEVSGAVAPGAKIVVYFAPNSDRGFFRAINRAIHDKINKPSVVSISWGGPEASWTSQAMTVFNYAFQAAAAMGITVCCASGDGGATDGVRGGLAHVDFPASSPFVLACGGTRLTSSGNTITDEVVWNDGPFGGAGGGGISDFFPLPTWQANINVPPSINPGRHVGRGTPDVAGDADPATGYRVRVDGQDAVIGGTSAVAPLWAGLIALMNQKLGRRVGYLNPVLYSQIASASGVFHDITKGNNDNIGHLGGYQATRGWDPCTGLGVADGTQLTAAL
jgi:kumamolisin